MPTENEIAQPEFDLSISAGGRGYIAHLFKTQLKRHDYTAYINERLAADFACTLAQHFEDIKAREKALQQRLTAAEQRNAELELDAGRYRFLRTRDLETISLGGVFAGMTPDNKVLNGIDLDAAIDAALKPTTEGAGE